MMPMYINVAWVLSVRSVTMFVIGNHGILITTRPVLNWRGRIEILPTAINVTTVQWLIKLKHPKRAVVAMIETTFITVTLARNAIAATSVTGGVR